MVTRNTLCLRRVLVMVALLLAGTVVVSAQEISNQLLADALDTVWIIYAATLVFFMQAGFAMLSAGLTRAKNVGNVLMKNLMDFAVGALVFWAVGWGLAYGRDVGGFIGASGFFLRYDAAGLAVYGVESITTVYRDWMFQVVFAGAAATIISGAMAERLKFRAYLIYSVIITGAIYPISTHWVWGGGWLGGLGFHDFAGSAVVHTVGGAAAFVGALFVGPRIGKYRKFEGRVITRAIVGHNIPLAALGTFILWFGWYGFNAGSTLTALDPGAISTVVINTTLSASAGAVGAMVASWLLFRKPETSMTLNGALAGLVGITAGCAVVGTGSAALIGLVSGVVVVLAVELFDKVLHVDDPVGAISVHGVCGILGTLAVGLFGNTAAVRGLFFGGGWHQLGMQALGVAAILAWVLACSVVLFGILKATRTLRVTSDEERIGLDIGEHGMESYSGFQIFSDH